MTRVLTGYLEPRTVRRIGQLAAEGVARSIDVGYRSWQPEPWLGRHGMLKGWIAERFRGGGPAARPADRHLDAPRGHAARRRLVPVPAALPVHDRRGGRRQHPGPRWPHPRLRHPVPRRASAGLLRGDRGVTASRASTARSTCAPSRRATWRRAPTPHAADPGRGLLQRDPGARQALHPAARGLRQHLRRPRCDDRPEAASEMAERAYRDVVAIRPHAYESFVATLLGRRPTASGPPSSRGDQPDQADLRLGGGGGSRLVGARLAPPSRQANGQVRAAQGWPAGGCQGGAVTLATEEVSPPARCRSPRTNPRSRAAASTPPSAAHEGAPIRPPAVAPGIPDPHRHQPLVAKVEDDPGYAAAPPGTGSAAGPKLARPPSARDERRSPDRQPGGRRGSRPRRHRARPHQLQRASWLSSRSSGSRPRSSSAGGRRCGRSAQ